MSSLGWTIKELECQLIHESSPHTGNTATVNCTVREGCVRASRAIRAEDENETAQSF